MDDENRATTGIQLTETMFLHAHNGQGRHTYFPDHVSVCDTLWMICCPSCCLKVPMINKKGNKITFSKGCGICSCPLQVKFHDELVGKIERPGCCDNGCCFCCCPWLNCSGHVKMMGVKHKDGQGNLKEKFVFTKELYACWPCIGACATFGVPCGMCYNSCDGCYQYTKGTECRTITQPVYDGPWSRGEGNPTKIGEIITTERFYPVGLCCAAPVKMAYGFQPKIKKGHELSAEELSTMSLVLAMYRGMPHPWRCCGGMPVQQPLGISCLDLGLGVKTEWKSVQEAMAMHT